MSQPGEAREQAANAIPAPLLTRRTVLGVATVTTVGLLTEKCNPPESTPPSQTGPVPSTKALAHARRFLSLVRAKELRQNHNDVFLKSAKSILFPAVASAGVAPSTAATVLAWTKEKPSAVRKVFPQIVSTEAWPQIPPPKGESPLGAGQVVALAAAYILAVSDPETVARTLADHSKADIVNSQAKRQVASLEPDFYDALVLEAANEYRADGRFRVKVDQAASSLTKSQEPLLQYASKSGRVEFPCGDSEVVCETLLVIAIMAAIVIGVNPPEK